MNICKILRERAKDFPFLKKGPKKELNRWVECPDFKIKDKEITPEIEIRILTTIYSDSAEEMKDMINEVIRIGKEEIVMGVWTFWLHATQISPTIRMKGKRLYLTELKYIFKVRLNPPEEIF